MLNKIIIEGVAGAAPLFFNKKHYENAEFPKNCLHKFSYPENYFYHHGIIPHLKTIVVTNKK